jgi:hypothetical protein
MEGAMRNWWRRSPGDVTVTGTTLLWGLGFACAAGSFLFAESWDELDHKVILGIIVLACAIGIVALVPGAFDGCGPQCGSSTGWTG